MTIRNRVTSPRFSHYWTFTNADHSIDVNHALILTKTSGAESFASMDGLDVSDCQEQSITIAASITSASSDSHQCGNGIILVLYNTGQIANLSSTSPDGLIQTGRQVLTVTVPDGATILNMRLYGPVEDGKTVKWWRPIMCKTEEYQLMLSGQVTGGTPIDYMDGDTMPTLANS
jgi:hypothetical protein